MFNKINPALAGALLLMWPTVPAVAHESPRENGSISGKVLTAAGEPVSDATVDLVDAHRRTQVNSDAHYHFNDVPAGTYLIEALSRRYGTGLTRVEVRPGTEIEVDIRLDLASQVDEIVVSAGGTARSSHELAQPVSVLGGEELALRVQPSLGETLAQEPGISSTYFAPGASRPVIRGLGGDRVRMLQSGLGNGDASSTSADHAVSVDAGVAERIEVVRGPATLLYGSSAIGGVVNVIDRKIPDYEVDKPLAGTIELRGGSAADERTGSFSLNGGGGRWAWHVDGLRRDTDDVDIPGFAELDAEEEHGDEHGEDDEAVRGKLLNSDVESTSGAVGATYFFSENRGFLGVSVSGFDTEYGLPFGHGHGFENEHEEEGDEHAEEEEEEGDVRVDLDQTRIDLRAEVDQDFGIFQVAKIRFGLSDYEHRELEGAEVGTIFTNDEWEGRLELVQKERGRWNGSLGLQVRDRDFEALGEEAFVPPSRTRSWALFAFEEWDKGKLRVQIGGRFENVDLDPEGALPARDFDGLSASAGLVWKIDDKSSLGVSLARSTKLPNSEELYSDGPHVATRTFELGDPNLGKETSLGLDLSLRRKVGRFTGELTLFANRFDDFIYQAFTGGVEEGMPVVRYIQDDAEFTGLEVQTRFELWHQGSGHLDLQLFGDYVRAELRESGEPLPRIPPLRYGAGFHYHTDRLHGMVEVRRIGEQDRVAFNETLTDGYTLVNASLSYRFFRGSLIYDLLLRGTNLGDEEARNHVSFLKDQVPLPGRDVSLVLRLWF